MCVCRSWFEALFILGFHFTIVVIAKAETPAINQKSSTRRWATPASIRPISAEKPHRDHPLFIKHSIIIITTTIIITSTTTTIIIIIILTTTIIIRT